MQEFKIGAYREAVWADSSLSPNAKLVALALGRYWNRERQACWPSISKLATDTGFVESTVKKALSELEPTYAQTAMYVRLERQGGKLAPLEFSHKKKGRGWVAYRTLHLPKAAVRRPLLTCGEDEKAAVKSSRETATTTSPYGLVQENTKNSARLEARADEISDAERDGLRLEAPTVSTFSSMHVEPGLSEGCKESVNSHETDAFAAIVEPLRAEVDPRSRLTEDEWMRRKLDVADRLRRGELGMSDVLRELFAATQAESERVLRLPAAKLNQCLWNHGSFADARALLSHLLEETEKPPAERRSRPVEVEFDGVPY